jgi:hypothetical protein
MQPIEYTKGFLTIAQNNNNVDYVRLAYALALSLKHSQKKWSNMTICVSPGTIIEDRYAWAFDKIVEIPWGDQAADSLWKLENEWKSIWMSPYDQTIKLDADMLFLSDISSWWKQFEELNEPVIACNKVLDWRGSVIESDFCRKTFTANNLPNVYSAFTYFNKSAEAFEFFELVKIITWNWQTFFDNFLEPNHRPEMFSTDVAFGLAMKILDLDQNCNRTRLAPVFTHMKSELQGLDTVLPTDWREFLPCFMTPFGSLNLGNHRQFYPLHYNIKEFITDDILKIYEELIKDVKRIC